MDRDIVIIGGGIIGCSIARELSKYDLKITVIEKEDDVASGISKANSGIIHAGYNEKKGTLKAKLNIEGNKLYDSLSKELDFTFIRNGAFVLAFNDNETEKLKLLKDNGESLGIKGLQILSKEEIKNMEPNISDNVTAALYAETSGIVNPYEVTAAFAENACKNGVEFMFNTEVINIGNSPYGYTLVLDNETCLKCKIIINAAGMNSDTINNMINHKRYTLYPVKGEYILLDKIAGKLVSRTIFQVPDEKSKGVLVTNTADGNLLIGPSADTVKDRESLGTDSDVLNNILAKSEKSVTSVPAERTITTFSGLRPHLESGDFVIVPAESNRNFITLVGIDSPGLTAAPAIAEYVRNMVSERIDLKIKKSFSPYRKRIIRFTELSFEEKNKLIKENPAYGKIICKCELISEGEILDAIHRPLGAKTVDAVKRRTRAAMGGCQGTGCMLPISRIISRELGIDITEVNKNSKSSHAVGFKEV